MSFSIKSFPLPEIWVARIVKSVRAIVSIDTTNECRAMNAMNFNEENPALPNHLFQNPYGLVLDLTSIIGAMEKFILRWNSAVEIFFIDR